MLKSKIDFSEQVTLEFRTIGGQSDLLLALLFLGSAEAAEPRTAGHRSGRKVVMVLAGCKDRTSSKGRAISILAESLICP